MMHSFHSSLGPSLATACGASQYFVFLSILDTMIRSNEKISGICEHIQPVKTPDDVYDFVVIGGGAAGSVVAARLSEIPDWKVLLLEAGPKEPPGAEVPGFATHFLETNIIWNYTITNESHACLLTNGSCSLPSGENLGGNTVHNAMNHIRGNPTDYNKWAAEGNNGWSWEDVKPFFLLSEDNQEIERVGTKYHGTGGPLSVSRLPYLPAMGNAILEGSEELGYGVSEDLNGEKLTGLSISQTTSKNGVRRSSARAFLWPVRNHKNLHVSLNSYATKIIIKNGKAVGVKYYKDGKRRTVHVTHEIILSGGTIESPHILLLSGIGPKKHLESMGIGVIKDLPGVGENFHDHASTLMTFAVNEPDYYDNNYVVAAQYINNQTGPLSGTGISPIVGLMATNATTQDYPDIQLSFAGYFSNCAPGGINALQSSGPRTIFVQPTYLHPKSRGRITLASNDPFEYPVITANYMKEPSDMAGVVEAMKITLKLMETDALRRYNLTLSTVGYEACSDLEFLSDEYLACAAQQIYHPLYHLVGSCKMGPASDSMAVVDSRLRVHGIQGLRVADGSVIPQVISGNTVASIMMIGERAADFIKKDWDSNRINCGRKRRIEDDE